MNPFKFFQTDQHITTENIRQFVRRQSNVKIMLSDCSKQYDIYAAKFVKAIKNYKTPEAEQVQAIVHDAFDNMTKLETENVCCYLISFHIACNFILFLFYFAFLGKTNCANLCANYAAYM